MSMTNVDKLKQLDEVYFEDVKPEDIRLQKHLIRRIATYLYDSDFDFEEESWTLLLRIKELFPTIYWKVLKAMFLRDHDT